MSHLKVILGDITASTTDAIVNAANNRMLGGGGVDGAIHRAAGPGLLAECEKVPAVNGVRCPTGEAIITSAANLACHYVIHTVGPIYMSDSKPALNLERAYHSCLKLALQYELKSIAFPAISCGVYGYPVEEAAEIAIKVCSEPTYASLSIEFVVFDQETYDIYSAILNPFQT
ncbi:macro domain-containing protein [Vibrio sp.]|nr:macro domain-containing protein [Vibrio sp.]